jgi:hypothetical protein
MKPKIMCQDCGKREYKVTFSDEPIYSMTHGYGGIQLCRECFIERIMEAKKKIDENLEYQKKMLAQGK